MDESWIVQNVVAAGLEWPASRPDPFPSLNDVPAAFVARLLRISNPYARERYLQQFLVPRDHRWARAFLADMEPFGDPGSWLRGHAAIRDCSLADQLTLPREALFLPDDLGVRTIVRPIREVWDAASYAGGAPARWHADSTYLTKLPEHFHRYLSVDVVEAPYGFDVAVRRWIAARVARCLSDAALVDGDLWTATHELVPSHAWSDDGRAAVRGLVAERAAGGWRDDLVPGFTGPDAPYEDGFVSA